MVERVRNDVSDGVHWKCPDTTCNTTNQLELGVFRHVKTNLPLVPQVQPLVLSSALEPIPAHLVGRIISRQFVEMRDLLSDNIALQDQLEVIQGMHHMPSAANSIRPRIREIPSLIT